jgi:hypothetical protein
MTGAEPPIAYRTSRLYWITVLLLIPGVFFLTVALLLIIWNFGGAGYGALDQFLRRIGMERVFVYVLGAGYLWGILAPVPIGLSVYFHNRMERSIHLGGRKQSVARWGIAASIASWFYFAYLWLSA